MKVVAVNNNVNDNANLNLKQTPSLLREGRGGSLVGGSPFFYIVAVAGQFVLHGELQSGEAGTDVSEDVLSGLELGETLLEDGEDFGEGF